MRHLCPAPDGSVASGSVPSFSVVIPAYQVAEFVGEAVGSALNQTLPPLEVIVCDDGSTDDIDGALAPYLDRITLIRQENRGLPAAKNAGARVASGEFVSILDGDDTYLPHRLEELGRLAAARPDLDILTTDVEIERAGEVIGRFYGNEPFVVDDQRLGMIRRCFITTLSAVRRDRLLAVDGFDESIDCADDWDCWLRLVLGGSKIGCVDEPLARYRLRSGAMTERRSRDFAGRLTVLRRVIERPDLSEGELYAARQLMAELEPRLQLANAREAVADGRSNARRLSLAVARSRHQSFRARARASLAVIAPSYARVVDRRMVRDPRLTVWAKQQAKRTPAKDLL